MSSRRIDLNRRFLDNLFRRGPFERHGLVLAPDRLPVWHLGDGDYTLSSRPVRDWLPWVVENYRRDVELLEKVPHDGVPYAKLGTGTQIYASAFGAPAHLFEKDNPAAAPIAFSSEDADRIEEPDLLSCRGLVRIFELAGLVERELGKDVPLGPPDMQTGFDTACLLWDKSSLYLAMADEEERASVHRLTAKCARLLKRFLAELRRQFPQMSPLHCPHVWCPPDLGPWISNDECGAISVEAFETFALPELIDLSLSFGGLGMHCCASAEHQFESFRKIPGFYGFNRVQARQGWETILEPFGGPDGPVHVIAWIEEADMARLVRTAPPGTRFIFNRFGSDVDEAQAWLERARALVAPR